MVPVRFSVVDGGNKTSVLFLSVEVAHSSPESRSGLNCESDRDIL